MGGAVATSRCVCRESSGTQRKPARVRRGMIAALRPALYGTNVRVPARVLPPRTPGP